MNLETLVTELRDLDQSLKSHVAQSANVGLTLRNWLVGAYIVEFEQDGEDRAKYGTRLTHELAAALEIKGLNARTLAHCRLIHLLYPLNLQTLSAKFEKSLIFERLGLSTDKEKLLRLTGSDETSTARPVDLIKAPYIFEFLGLTPREAFRENDLETALLDHLQDFLLEPGKGFCFEDRQKKLRIGKSDFFVDLVFYHRKLHCHVLIELKVEAFNHANAGQLNTYVNYYRKREMAEGDNPPVGLLLCTDKDHALVEYALGGMDENLSVSTYNVALPKPEELEEFLRREIAPSKS